MKKKHEEISSSSDSLFEKNPKVFELQFFFSNSLKDPVRKSKITGTPAANVDISSVVHRSLSDQFVPFIVTGFSFEPIINADSFSLITTKKQCRYFITLMYQSNI